MEPLHGEGFTLLQHRCFRMAEDCKSYRNRVLNSCLTMSMLMPIFLGWWWERISQHAALAFPLPAECSKWTYCSSLIRPEHKCIRMAIGRPRRKWWEPSEMCRKERRGGGSNPHTNRRGVDRPKVRPARTSGSARARPRNDSLGYISPSTGSGTRRTDHSCSKSPGLANWWQGQRRAVPGCRKLSPDMSATFFAYPNRG